jgi:uncharacterized RDD family membrane protein YckC
MPTTAENELRAMIGDLFMQMAVLRTELVNLKEQQPEQQTTKPNGRGKEEQREQDHPPQ